LQHGSISHVIVICLQRVFDSTKTYLRVSTA